jgi:hypothetical protein
VTVSVVIKQFLSNTRRLGSLGPKRSGTDQPHVTVEVFNVDSSPLHVDDTFEITRHKNFDCGEIEDFDRRFESGPEATDVQGDYFKLLSGRSGTAQPSPPEEVLDNILSDLATNTDCSYKPEGDDGPTK